MKKLLLLLIIPFLSFGQGWEQILGNGAATSAQQTTDGGYILYGREMIESDGPIKLVKTDSEGNQEWERLFLEGSFDRLSIGSSVEQTVDGGYVVCASYKTCSGSGSDCEEFVYILKTDEDGQDEWFQQISHNLFFSPVSNTDIYASYVHQTSDGGYIVYGQLRLTAGSSFFPSTRFGFLLKLNEYGQDEWFQTYEGVSRAYAFEQTDDGGYIFAYSNSDTLRLKKTDGSGIEQWTQNFDGLESVIANSVHQTSDGGYSVAGSILEDCYLLKTDSNGEEEWSQTFGGTGVDWGTSVQQTTDGGYVLAGFYGANLEDDGLYFDNANIYLVKTDSEGNINGNTNVVVNPDDVIWIDPDWADFDWEAYWDDLDLGVVVDWDNIPWGVIISSDMQPEDLIYYIILQNITSGGMPFIWDEFIEFINNTDISESLIGKNIITTIDILGRESTNKGFQLHIYDDGSVEKRYIID